MLHVTRDMIGLDAFLMNVPNEPPCDFVLRVYQLLQIFFLSFFSSCNTDNYKKVILKKLDGIAASVKDSLQWNTSTSQNPPNYIVLNFGFQRRGNFLGSSVDHLE